MKSGLFAMPHTCGLSFLLWISVLNFSKPVLLLLCHGGKGVRVTPHELALNALPALHVMEMCYSTGSTVWGIEKGTMQHVIDR